MRASPMLNYQWTLALAALWLASRATTNYPKRLPPLTHQLIRQLINAYDRIASVIGFDRHIQNVFHAPDELGADHRYTLLFPSPGLQHKPLSVRRTVSSEMVLITRRSIPLLASDGIVHC